jgi:hypothetical protein
MKKIFAIFLLCINILNLSSCGSKSDSNIKKLEVSCIHSGFIKYEEEDIDTNSFWIIRDLEEWSKNRNKYIPTVNLVPSIDYGTFDFSKYDLILLKGRVERDSKLLYGFEVKDMVLKDNVLNISAKRNSVAIINNSEDYLESFLILKVRKGILPLDSQIKITYLDDKSYVETSNNENIVNLFTGFTDNWSLYKEQGVEKKAYIFNNKEEWTKFRNKHISDIDIPDVNFDQYSVVLYEDFNGAKPTFSSAFKIVDVYMEKDTLNIICDSIPTYINFESHLGLAISKVSKEFIKGYTKINVSYME